jgi:hypothetical protein
MYSACAMRLGFRVLALVAATSVVACSSRGLRTDAGVDAPASDAPASSPDGPEGGAPFNPCPAPPETAGGTIAAGQPCTSSLECLHAAGEAVACEPSNAADVQAKVQTCHRFARVALGAACSSSRTLTGQLAGRFPSVNPGESLPAQAGLCDARDNLTCDWATHTCAPFAELGADCSTRACNFSTRCFDGVCAALIMVGHECDFAAELSGEPWCEAGAYCDLATQRCTRKRAQVLRAGWDSSADRVRANRACAGPQRCASPDG